jgi:hypothetical protein
MSNRIINTLILDSDVDITSAATQATNAVDVSSISLINVTTQISFASTAGGSVKLQGNLEPADKTAIWFDLDDAAITGTNNSQAFTTTGDILNWALLPIALREIRGLVTVTSGTVNAYTRLHAKQN